MISSFLARPRRRSPTAAAIMIAVAFAMPAPGQSVSLNKSAIQAQSLISVQELGAPAKARRAAEKAAKAMIRNDLAEAKRQVNIALQVYPTYSLAVALRGVTKMAEYDDTNAIEDFEEAIKIDPNIALPYIAIGTIRNESGRFEEALPVLQRGLELAPNAWQAHFEQSRSFYGLKRYFDALKKINEALQLAGRAADREILSRLHVTRGYVLAKLGDYPNAKSDLTAALQEEPDGEFVSEVRNLLGKIDERSHRAGQ